MKGIGTPSLVWLAVLVILLGSFRRVQLAAVADGEDHEDHDHEHLPFSGDEHVEEVSSKEDHHHHHSHEEDVEEPEQTHDGSNDEKHDEIESRKVDVHEDGHNHHHHEGTHEKHEQHVHHQDHADHHHDDHDHVDHGVKDELDSESEEFPVEVLQGYGEECSGGNDQCNKELGLICVLDSGRCDCDEKADLTYSTESQKCEKVHEPKISHDEHAEHEHHDDEHNVISDTDVEEAGVSTEATQTQRGKSGEDEEHSDHAVGVHGVESKCGNVHCADSFGEFSKCHEETGECVCHDIEQGTRPVHLVAGKCWLERKINDTCSSHEDCTSVIKGRAWCHLDLESNTKYCTCEVFHYFDTTLQECLLLAMDGLTSPCQTDQQCIGVGIPGQGLGPNGKCSESHTCDCTEAPDGSKGILHDNHCYHSLKMGDACKTDKECQISLPGLDVECSDICRCIHENSDGSCPLPVGDLNTLGRSINDEDKNDGAIESLKSAMGINVPNFVLVLIIGAVILCIGIVLSVFILRKKHRYTVVRTQP